MVEQGEPGGVAVATFADQVLAKQPLIGETEAFGGAFGAQVGVVAFPFQAAVAEFEGVAGQQVDRFTGQGAALHGMAKTDVADLDAAMGRADIQVTEQAEGLVAAVGDDRVKHGVARIAEAVQPLGEISGTGKWPVAHIGPHVRVGVCTVQGQPEVVAVARGVESLQAHPIALQHGGIRRPGCLPVFEVGVEHADS